ncbi:hypothetical protein [Thermococcus sp.]|uniref:hypothetical protein n=1 Tax=Thermococcus sp. TaxID=35749 RepID=UPI0026237400|nr:hypothetical protein [Thermococcus sp.]
MAGSGRKVVKAKAVISSILIALYIGAVILTASTLIASRKKTFLGEPAVKLLHVHIIYGMIMLCVIAVHLYLNWGMYKSELKVLRS